MGTLVSNLVVRLTDLASAPAKGLVTSLGHLRREARGFGAFQASSASGVMGTVKSLALMGAGYLGVTEGLNGTVGAAMRFEDSMSDIRKVIDFKSPKQFTDMRSDILDMSRRLPIAADGIAAITAAAGQANIPMEDLKAFTEMTAKVSTAWDISAGDTGTSLAKMKTSLQLTVSETALLADAINYLSNASAAGAPDILKFSRGMASGKLAGFAAKETLAFGTAMISSGFEAEVAETSFQNMTKALTAGSNATTGQRTAYRKLGLDAVKVSKAMQKDAVGTTLKVFEQLGKLPKHQQGAIATALFGSEARALPSLIGNMGELRRTLGLVADDTAYAGSAAAEFEQASKRTSNTLQVLKNNVSAIGIGLGDMALPTINEWAGKLAETLMTLDQRVTVFDKIGAGVKGFMSGLGLKGDGIGEQFGNLYDGIFGRIDSFEKDTDRLGALFLSFREMGESVKSFADNLSSSVAGIEHFFNLDPGTIVDTLGSLGSLGFKLAIASVGIGMAAGALMSLGRAVMFLSGASFLVGGAKGIARLLGAVAGGSAAAGAGAAAGGAATAAAGAGATGGIMAGMKSFVARGGMVLAGLASWVGMVQYAKHKQETDPAWIERQKKADQHTEQNFQWLKGLLIGNGADPNFSFRDHMGIDVAAGDGARPPSALGPFADQKSSGPQPVTLAGPAAVTITNPPPRPNINVDMSVTIHEASNVDAIAGQLGQRIRSEMEGLQADTNDAGY